MRAVGVLPLFDLPARGADLAAGSAAGPRSKRRSFRSRKNSLVAWNWWQFQPPSSKTPSFREPLRHEVEVALVSRSAARPAESQERKSSGAWRFLRQDRAGSTTSATVRSFGLPSSGAMKLSAGSRSVPSEYGHPRDLDRAPRIGDGSPRRPMPRDSRQRVESAGGTRSDTCGTGAFARAWRSCSSR